MNWGYLLINLGSKEKLNSELFEKIKMGQTEELLELADGRELENELISLFEITSRLEYELELAIRLRDD